MRDDIYGKGRRQGRNRSSETEGDDNRFRASHVYAQCCRMSDFEYNVAAHKWPESWRHILGLVQGGLITPVDVDERWCSCFCAATVARVACSAEGCMPLPLTKRAGRIGRIGGLAGTAWRSVGLFAGAVGLAISHGDALGKPRDGGGARW
jgi:hypothetical protein